VRIEDCEVGMEVRKTRKATWDFIKLGETAKVNKIFNRKVSNLELITEDGETFNTSAKYYEPVGVFEVGDEVVYYNGLFKVWGYVYNNILKEYNYALKNDDEEVTIAVESQLSPPKKKDELEVGDKFKNNGNKMEVLAVGKDDYYHHVEYYARKISGTEKGMTSLIPAHNIDEIIYE
jgi:hypothetical protein